MPRRCHRQRRLLWLSRVASQRPFSCTSAPPFSRMKALATSTSSESITGTGSRSSCATPPAFSGRLAGRASAPPSGASIMGWRSRSGCLDPRCTPSTDYAPHSFIGGIHDRDYACAVIRAGCRRYAASFGQNNVLQQFPVQSILRLFCLRQHCMRRRNKDASDAVCLRNDGNNRKSLRVRQSGDFRLRGERTDNASSR